MSDNSEFYDHKDVNRLKCLNILFCQSIFDALEKTFGKKIAMRYIQSDSCLSADWLDFVLLKDKINGKQIFKQATLSDLSAGTIDLFRETYNQIFPQKIRHLLGEYYTPSWMANQILNQLEYSQNELQTLLDPCCGSGVFLLQGLNRIITIAQKNRIPMTAELFTNHLFGFDINPIAIFACKANLRINVFRLTGILLPDELNNIRSLDFLSTDKNVTEFNTNENICPDLVAGNPPWISWDNLDSDYRHQLDSLWKYYNLFHLTGTAARYGGSKKDLSELFFYVACSKLKFGGKIGFILPRNLLFNVASGGFRCWELPDKTPLKIEQVEDYSQLNVFGTYAAKACCIYVQKGTENQYPVKYIEVVTTNSNKYTKVNSIKFSDLTTNIRQAFLSNPLDKLSVWTLEDKCISCKIIDNSQKGNNHEYTAHLGANSGGANGVFWLKIIDKVDDNHVTVRNLSQCSKKDVPTIETVIESALLYPLARWKSIDRGVTHLDNTVILVVQDPIKRTGINRDVMETLYPLTLKYLLHFEDLLSCRAAQKRYQSRGEFYSMYNVGQYTFSDWKCVWRRMDKQIRAVALGPQSVSGLPIRPVFPQETCVFIPAKSESEACYLSAVMNSSPINKIACLSSNVGGKGFGSPCLLTRIPLPRYNEQNSIHLELSNAGKQLGLSSQDESVQRSIDELVTKLLDFETSHNQPKTGNYDKEHDSRC